MERVIFGDGVVLRVWRRDDGPALELILERSRQAFGDWLPGATKDLADIPAFLDHVEAAYGDGTAFFYAIEEGGEALGQCSLHYRASSTGEIGYWVRTDRAGDGIASRAVNSLVTAAYDEGLRELVIHCDEGNVRSARVAASAGFVHLRTAQLDPTLPRTRAQTGREMTWVRRLGSGAPRAPTAASSP
jgi:RimJ/RimL family protein N-acetyltransferase